MQAIRRACEVFFAKSHSPPDQDVLAGMVRPAAGRRDRHRDDTDRAHLCHQARRQPVLPNVGDEYTCAAGGSVAPGEYRATMMPVRKRSRAKARADRVKQERALNDAYVAERNKPPPFGAG